MCGGPLLRWEETVLHTHTQKKKTSNWLWHCGDRSLKHDVLIMLPQHCQNVTAPQHVADKGDAGGPGTLGQPIWKAAKDCGGMGEWAVNHQRQWSGATTVALRSLSTLWGCSWKDKFHTLNIQAALINIPLLTIDQLITCNLKRAAKSEKPTKNISLDPEAPLNPP